MKMFDLPVMCGREKSFYGKAKVIEQDNGEKVLQSYNTQVCKITSGGEFVRMWSGYSVTTMRHVDSFLSFYGQRRREKLVERSTGTGAREKAGAGEWERRCE